MVKYYYDIDEEGFKREDRRGRMLPINITEARRIQSLLDLGWGVDSIDKKMNYTSPMATPTTTKSFVKNLKEGNISLEGDYPAPSKVMEHMDLEARLNAIEQRLDALENQECTCSCESEDSSWRNLWGKL